jgi:tetratricopeptide (TPR) repeat protein
MEAVMNRKVAILALIFLLSFLAVPVWCGEGRFVIEDDTPPIVDPFKDVVPDKKLSDDEQCKNAFHAEAYDIAYPACLKAAELGDEFVPSFLLGVMYDLGMGVKKDYTEAFKWYRKAAELGHIMSQSVIADMYYEGRGVKQGYAEAAAWNRKAAEQGDADAQYNLGISYMMGQGVKQDYAEAASWYRKAAEQGDADAQYELAKRYISGEGVEINRFQAKKWLIHSISKDETNKNTIKLLEKEFGWHCILTDDGRCFTLVNKNSIIHDKNLSWCWMLTTFKSDNGEFKLGNEYSAISCNNSPVAILSG